MRKEFKSGAAGFSFLSKLDLSSLIDFFANYKIIFSDPFLFKKNKLKKIKKKQNTYIFCRRVPKEVDQKVSFHTSGWCVFVVFLLLLQGVDENGQERIGGERFACVEIIQDVKRGESARAR